MSGVAGRTGATWERIVADRAQEAGLPWERAPLRGNHDLLDIQGCLPGGWMVGCKGIRRGTEFGAKISAAMDQCDRALLNLRHPYIGEGNGYTTTGQGKIIVASNGIIPVQVMQRSGFPVDKAYVVLQFGHFLDLAVRRQKWRDDE